MRQKSKKVAKDAMKEGAPDRSGWDENRSISFTVPPKASSVPGILNKTASRQSPVPNYFKKVAIGIEDRVDSLLEKSEATSI